MKLVRKIGIALFAASLMVGSSSTSAIAQPANPAPDNPLPISQWPEPTETGPVGEPSDGQIGILSVENCRVYNSGGTTNPPPRRYCFRIEGGGTYVEWFRVVVEAPVEYSHIRAQTFVQGPEGETSTYEMSLIPSGNGVRWDINNFVKAGTYCLWIRLQNNQQVWEPWQTMCSDVY